MAERFYFTQPENAVMFDKEISSTAKIVYCAILKFANVKTRKCNIFMKTLAEEVGRSVRTVQRVLKQLIEKGLIIRTERYGIDGGNIASSFEIAGQAEKEGGTTELTPKGDTNGGQNKDNIYNDIITLKGEAELPSPDENFNFDVQEQAYEIHEQEKAVENAPGIDSVPDIMRPTARYLLQRTGRKSLRQNEIEPLRILSRDHMPSRVQKEIDTACERFLRKGKELIGISFNYILGALKNQKTFIHAPKKTPVLEVDDPWGAEVQNLIFGGATA